MRKGGSFKSEKGALKGKWAERAAAKATATELSHHLLDATTSDASAAAGQVTPTEIARRKSCLVNSGLALIVASLITSPETANNHVLQPWSTGGQTGSNLAT